MHILDGRIPHSLLLEIFTNKGIGTAILREDGENIMMSMHEQMEQAEKVFFIPITDFRSCLTVEKAAGFMIQRERIS